MTPRFTRRDDAALLDHANRVRALLRDPAVIALIEREPDTVARLLADRNAVVIVEAAGRPLLRVNPAGLPVRFELSCTEGIKRAILDGEGMGWISRCAVADELASGTLRVGAEARLVEGEWTVTKAIMSRSARILMEGWVRVPGDAF